MYNRDLEIFVDVANTGSFTKTAENFNTSSTAIMKQINSLERDLKVKLFIRSHQGVKLTEAGDKIYHTARYLIDYSKRAVEDARGTQNNIITIGTSVICPSKPLTDIWSKIGNKYPDYKIKIAPFEDNHTEVLSTLNSSAFDIIVSPNDSKKWQENFGFLKLGDYKSTVSMPRTHRLANRKVLSTADFSNETVMIITSGDSETINRLREDISRDSKNVNFIPMPFLYDISVFNECEENGYILMTLDAWKDIHPGLITIPLDKDYKIPYGIVYQKNPSQKVKDFIEIVRSNI